MSLIYYPAIQQRTFLSQREKDRFDHYTNRAVLIEEEKTIIKVLQQASKRKGEVQCTRVYTDDAGVAHAVLAVHNLASGINFFDLELMEVGSDVMIADMFSFNQGSTLSNYFREQILVKSKEDEDFTAAYEKLAQAYVLTKTGQWQAALQQMDAIPLTYRDQYPDFMAVEALAILLAEPEQSYQLLGARMNTLNRERYFAFQALMYYLEQGYYNQALPMLATLRKHVGEDNIVLDQIEIAVHLNDGEYERVHDMTRKWEGSSLSCFEMGLMDAYALVYEGESNAALEKIASLNSEYGTMIEVQEKFDEFWAVSDSVTVARKVITDSLARTEPNEE